MCRTAQTRTGKRGKIVQRPQTPVRPQHMLLTIGVLVTVTAAVIIRKMRAAGDAKAKNLGWMSDQWLAEHRASHLS